MRRHIIYPSILLMLTLLAGCQPDGSIRFSDPASITGQIPPAPAATPTPQAQVAIDQQTCSEQVCLLDGHFVLTNPIPVHANQAITGSYRFGSNLEGEREIHHGVEFANPSGTPVLAAADGSVLFAGDDSLTSFGLNPHYYGKLVVLEHHLKGIEQVVYTLYAHLAEVTVESGEQVFSGQQIGSVGRSGSALGSHLHFEVRLNENTYAAAVNPELWLTLTPDATAKSFGALAGAILNERGEPTRVSNIQLEYSPSEAGPVEKHLSFATYFDESVSTDPALQENFVAGGLQPGWYRVVFIANGTYFSKWVQVDADKLTYLSVRLP